MEGCWGHDAASCPQPLEVILVAEHGGQVAFVRHLSRRQRKHRPSIQESLYGRDLQKVFARSPCLLMPLDGAALPVVGSPLLAVGGD